VPVNPASDALAVAAPTSPVGDPSVLAPRSAPPASGPVAVATFDQVYEEHFSFVWRSVRSLGVAPSFIEDVVQDVFIVVHRRLDEFDATRSSLRTWLFGILRRTIADHRRTRRRKPAQFGTQEGDAEVEGLTDGSRNGPHESAARAQAVQVLSKLLDSLDDEKREVFVLAELEQMSVPEIAQAIEINVNTAYARLRAARKDFEEAVQRHRAKDGWRNR
jgi:RNA polymerase sigma-70 factor (ECF subfamily)